jgi:hypothetical protein
MVVVVMMIVLVVNARGHVPVHAIVSGSRAKASATIGASRWQPLPVLTWIAGAPVARMRSASNAGLLVALDHRQRQPRRARRSASMVAHSSVVLPEPGLDTRFRRHAVRGEVRAVLLGDAVVGAQHVGLELDRARLAHARHRHPRRAGAEVQVAGARTFNSVPPVACSW